MIRILSELVITKIRSIGTMYTPKSNNKVIRKNRPCWGAILKYEGETIYKNSHSQYVSDANHLVILPKGASYEWSCTQSGHYIIVDFESDLDCADLFSLDITENDGILKMFKELEKLRLSKKPLFEMESINLVYSLILKSIKSHFNNTNYTPSAKKNRLLPAINYIVNNFTKPIRNEDLAVYGISPMTYIHNLRIRRAKEMLRSDYSSITDIAFTLGYNSIYEFSKDFKKHTGVSPSKY